MSKIFSLLTTIGFGTSLYFAQVGINTTTPAATLDVVAKNATANSVDGIIAPRIDRLRASDMSGVPEGTLIYINNISTGTPTGKTINVKSTGYYYFDGTVWQKMNNGESPNIYNSDGTIVAAGNRTVTMGTNTVNWNSSAATTNTMNLTANSLTTGNALNISTTGLTTGSAVNITSANGSTNTNGVIKVANSNGTSAGTFATLQANSTSGSGVSILNNGNTGIGTRTPGSTLSVEGSVSTQYREISATTYSILDIDNYISYTGSTDTSFTLPAGSASIKGREYVVRNSSNSNVNVTVTVSGGSNLDVAAAQSTFITIPKGYSASFKATGNLTGTTWLVTLVSSSSTSRVLGNGLYRTTAPLTYNTYGTIPYDAASFDKYTIIPFASPTGEITVGNDGNYQTSLRWWGHTDATVSGPTTASAYFRLAKKDSSGNLTTLDEIEYYAYYDNGKGAITFTVNLLGTGLKAGDKLIVYIRPSVGGNWKTGTIGTTTVFNPSLLVIQQ